MVWNHTRDFKFCRARGASLIWNHKYDFRPKIALLSFQLPLYYSHYEIAKFIEYLYFIGPVAGLLKSGIANAFTSYFVYEIEMLGFRAKMVWFGTEMMQFRTDVINSKQ